MQPRILLAAFLLLGALTTGCDAPPEDSTIADTQRRLQGTWLREYKDAGAQVRRVLVLEPGGRFTEEAKARIKGAVVSHNSHSGEWLYDGTNLKRRYKLIDGKKPSAPIVPFAALQLRFESRSAFIGADNVHKHEVRYERVETGTLP